MRAVVCKFFSQRKQLVVKREGPRDLTFESRELSHLKEHTGEVVGISGTAEKRQRSFVGRKRSGGITGILPFTSKGEHFSERRVDGELAHNVVVSAS